MYNILHLALDVVSRELVGFIPAVTRDASADRAAIGDTIYYPVVSTFTPGSITAASTGPTGSDMSAPATSATISKAYSVPVYLTGEESKGLRNSGSREAVLTNAFAQAMRALVNLIEVDLFTVAYTNASRAYGTAGTAPFGTASDLSDLAQAMKILDDNGAPTSTRRLVLSTAALANLRAKQSVSLAAAGSDEILRTGALGDILGVRVGASGGISAHTKGTGTGYLVDLTAGYAAGSTTIHLDTGTNTILAGDVVTNATTARADTNKYIIGTGGTGGEADYVLNSPGLKIAWVNNDAVSIGNSYTPNLLFSQDAVFLACRAPAVPEEGDAATDSIIVTDPISGLSFEVREYRQYRQVAWDVGIAWGYKAIKDAHIATILG
jgi:hypothetical protein